MTLFTARRKLLHFCEHTYLILIETNNRRGLHFPKKIIQQNRKQFETNFARMFKMCQFINKITIKYL